MRGYGGCDPLVLTTQEVARVVEEFEELIDQLEEKDVEIDDVIYDYANNTDNSVYNDLLTEGELESAKAIVEKTCEYFKKEYGVTISPAHHDSDDDGSSFDQISGGFFIVSEEGYFELTDGAKKLEKLGIRAEHKDYVVYYS